MFLCATGIFPPEPFFFEMSLFRSRRNPAIPEADAIAPPHNAAAQCILGGVAGSRPVGTSVGMSVGTSVGVSVGMSVGTSVGVLTPPKTGGTTSS